MTPNDQPPSTKRKLVTNSANSTMRKLVSSPNIFAAITAFAFLASFTTASTFAAESEFAGLIRNKTPDRQSYRAPTLPIDKTTAKPTAQETEIEADEVEIAADEFPFAESEIDNEGFEPPVLIRGRVRQVGYQPQPTTRPVTQAQYPADVVFEEAAEPGCGMEPACGCEAAGFACDGSCLSQFEGCDSCGSCNSVGGCTCKTRFSFDPCQWFGSLELLMMWRVGDGLPALVTTSPTGSNGAGVIGATGTTVLFGNERVLGDLTAGGRVTIGTFLDNQQNRSLVVRGWGAGQADYSFATDQTRNSIIARPFFNVALAPQANGSLVIADTTRTGSINLKGSNDVYGGDISLRQQWLGGLGGVIDVLYGYQYMRMEDRLQIASSSLTNATANPANTTLAVADQFHAENEFHGGQLGVAARYRERNWSFNGTIKAAAGSLRRTSIRSGSTTTTVAGNSTVDPNGLLVRSTNSGRINDNTFAWVPELDATLGWRWTRNLDLTFGYHIIAMTDALQVSGMIDPNLAVNASNPLTGQLSPSAALRYQTYYVHGIHFGVQVVY